MNGSRAYVAERYGMPRTTDLRASDPGRANAECCSARPPPAEPIHAICGDAMLLSPGDLVQLGLPGNEASSGNYKIDTVGVLNLDVMGELRTTGLTIKQAEAELSRWLVATGCFRPDHSRATLKLPDRGAIRVCVSGAVFQAGRVIINQKSAPDRDMLHDAAGDHVLGRSLSIALSYAGGVRPAPDVVDVAVTRAGDCYT